MTVKYNHLGEFDYDDADNNHIEFDYLRQELFSSSCAIIRTCALTRTAYTNFFNFRPAQSHIVTIVALDCPYSISATNKQNML